MTKQKIRKKSLVLRASLLNRAEMDEKIHHAFFNSEIYQSAGVIMTYLSYKSEVDTLSLVDKMIADGKILSAPVCLEKGEMNAYRFDNLGELTPSAMGILEPPKTRLVLPEEIDLIIVPGCAFTEEGFRLGYGGGYYDRYLSKTTAVTCGFFYDCLKAAFVPEKTDVPLDFVITEKEIYRFGERRFS